MNKNDIDLRIAELQREKETLSQQVKRLIKAEGKLYQYQEELDAQLKEYKDLYELNGKLNTTFDIENIFQYTVAYATQNLEYERAVLFHRPGNTGGYHVGALDGYYDKQEKSSVGAVVIEQDDPVLSPLFAGREYLICKADAEEKELLEYRSKLRMNEYVIYRLGTPPSPHAVLAIGNSAENVQFYRKVSDSAGTLLNLGNLVGLISSSIEKHIYFRKMETALEQEKLAEAKYRGIFENAVEGIFQTTPTGQFLDANPALARMLGYASSRELLANITDINRQLYVEPERRSQFQRFLEENDTVEGFETRFYRKDGSVIWVSTNARLVRNAAGQVLYYEGTAEDITERKRAEEERLSHLQFLESLERVDRAIRKADTLEGMMTDVLNTALSIFKNDRAWLLYPCDPEAPSWRVPMERTRPEYPGVLAMGIDMPMTFAISERFREALNSDGPVIDDPQSGNPVPPEISKRFSVRSQIMTAVYPKMGKPWLFGLHQCSYERIWGEEDARLFTEIARRIADGLSSLLFLKDLQESEGRFRALVENLPVKVFIKDRKSVYIDCNPSYAQDLGIKPEEIQGRTDYDFHPRELAEKYRADDKRIMDSGRGEELEERYVKDGRQCWAQTIKTPLRGTAEYVTGILGVFWDITERKRAEEALKESEERYRVITVSAFDAIITIDEESRMIFTNPAVERIFGYTRQELDGNNLTMLMPERMRQAHLNAVKRYCASGRKQLPWGMIEMPGLRKDGREIPLELSYGEFSKNGRLFFAGFIRDVSERKRAEETIRYQAYHDLLTGLPNRVMFSDRLGHEIAQMQRIRKKLAVLFLDIDQFKNINDSLGHAAGDVLIRDVTGRLQSCTREFDTVARFGGDEFSILLPLITRVEDASKTAEKIMAAFKEPFIIDGHELRVTASMGIALSPEDGNTEETLMKNAEIAMFHAKERGRNNFQFYNPAINIRTLERIILASSLRRAIDRGELIVHYQPQQNLKTGKITGAEALVRWNHPDLGLLKPGQFIPLAEEIGVIIEIDQWVMRRACEQLKAWEAAGHGPQFITTNLSARQFQQPDLAKIISDVLKETQLNPERLGVEITETIAMQDTELTARNMSSLNAMGVRFLIDDFGTGYSSLSYLKKLPIHKLKIDQSFITSLSKDRDYQAITNAIIAMAHILKVKVVAEGVETEDQMSFLNSRDCDEMQGYLFSKPVPAREFEKLLVSASS